MTLKEEREDEEEENHLLAEVSTYKLSPVPRPDKKQDPLGLASLDEPSCGQTDPQILDLRLRALAKGATGAALDVKTLPDSEDAEAINEWMDSVDNVHRLATGLINKHFCPRSV